MKYKVGDIVKLSTGERATITRMFRDNVFQEFRYSGTIEDDDYDEYNFDEKEIIGLWEECKSSEQVNKSEGKSTEQVDKYRLIDILNKIANGELKEGTKVIYKTNVFDWDGNVLIDVKNKSFFGTMKTELNDELELIEPQEPTDNNKIEELDIELINKEISLNHFRIMAANKLNEVIRYINKENNNE